MKNILQRAVPSVSALPQFKSIPHVYLRANIVSATRKWWCYGLL